MPRAAVAAVALVWAITAHAAPWAPDPFVRAAEVWSRDVLTADTVTPRDRLRAAAQALAAAIGPLRVEPSPDGVRLIDARHQTTLGVVAATSPADLPAALHALELAVGPLAGPLDDRVLRRIVLDGAARVGDPWARIEDDADADALSQVLRGVVGEVGVRVATDAGGWVVAGVDAGSPAEAARLRVGDRLVGIDGVRPVDGADPGARLRGSPGTSVLVDVVPVDGGAPRRVVLVRAAVDARTVRATDLGDGVVALRPDVLGPRTAGELRATLQALGRAGTLSAGLVLDLRGQGGGTVESAAAVLDRLLPEGPLGATAAAPDARVPLPASWSSRTDGDEPPVPITVWIDGGTASAATWIAAVLRARVGASLVGGPAHPKRAVQVAIPLGDGLRLRASVATLADPTGPLPDGGLRPDVALSAVDAPASGPWRLRDPGVLALGAPVQLVPGPHGTPDDDAWRDVFTARGLDGRPATRPPAPDTPAASLTVAALDDGRARLALRLTGATEPLHRAIVVLDAGSTPWDGVAIPLGRVQGRSDAHVDVPARAGAPPRADSVRAWLLADGLPPVLVSDGILSRAGDDPSPPALVVAVEAGGVLRVDGPTARTAAQLHIAPRGLDGVVRARADWPVGMARAALSVPADARAGHDLIVTLADGLSVAVPVGAIGTGPLDVVAPRVRAPGAPTIVDAGRISWPVEVEGDDTIADVVVLVDGVKVAWLPGGPRVRVDVPVSVAPGPHRVTVRATDAAGVVTVRSWPLTARATASPVGPPRAEAP